MFNVGNLSDWFEYLNKVQSWGEVILPYTEGALTGSSKPDIDLDINAALFAANDATEILRFIVTMPRDYVEGTDIKPVILWPMGNGTAPTWKIDYRWFDRGEAIPAATTVAATARKATAPSDLVSNGAFASDTVWTKGDGWTIGSGTGSSDGSQTEASDLSQAILTVGKQYRVVYTVSGYSAGNLTPYAGATAGTSVSANGTYREFIDCTTNTSFSLQADADFVGSVDNVTVHEVIAQTDTFAAIDGSGISGVNSVLLLDVYREDNDLAGDAAFWAVGFNYKRYVTGSRNEYSG